MNQGKAQSPPDSWFDPDANINDIGTELLKLTEQDPLELDLVSCLTYFTNAFTQFNKLAEWCVKN